ncbi:hypothetical protein LTR04_002855, partial [Oleoguttula sp. CCFEE 6159]
MAAPPSAPRGRRHQHHRSVSSSPPALNPNDLVDNLLATLDRAGPPSLCKSQLWSIFEATKSRVAPSLKVWSFDELYQFRGYLAEAVFNAKIQGPMSTATLDQFLGEIARIVRERNGAQLQDYLVIEPPYRELYNKMIVEIRQSFPKGREDALEAKCSALLPEVRDGVDGASWTAFIKFIVQYFCFLKDVNIDNLLDTYNLLSELLHLGIVILPTVISYSRTLSRLAIGLDKQPGLIAHLTQQSTDEGGARETLPERAANILRQAFVTCLNDRSGAPSGISNGKPDGKRSGIYTIANLCLKILFQCRKTRNAEQIFANIYNQSPPLSIYSRAERVTYLYYLGRFLFQNNHFYRAQLALQQAYDDCHAPSLRQRRLILIYLIASNMILGRFPSTALLDRPEAAGLAARFHPLCRTIAAGDLAAFRRILALDAEHAPWFLHYRILLQLRNRCEPLVYRSLVRRVFVLAGNQGDLNARKAPTVDLHDVLHAARWLERKALLPPGQHSTRTGAQWNGGKPGERHTNWIFMDAAQPQAAAPFTLPVYIDPDFAGLPTATDPTNADSDSDPDANLALPRMLEVEALLSSLIAQGLLNGFISHRQLRFAIQGAKKKGALDAGFPPPWRVIGARCDGEVPGWRRDGDGLGAAMMQRFGGGGAGLGGMVINLSGARP